MKIRPCTVDDLPSVLVVFSQAKSYQRSLGFCQWADDYPAPATLQADISESHAYVIVVDGCIAGYVALSADNDNEYDRLGHIWSTEGRYLSIHRLALSDSARGRKVSAVIFAEAEALARAKRLKSIRVDTGVENKVMQHILLREGYRDLGRFEFVWGDRIAFDKVL